MPIYTGEGTTTEQVQSMINQFAREVINGLKAKRSKIQ